MTGSSCTEPAEPREADWWARVLRLRRLGPRAPDVMVGPAHGVDVGVVRVAPGTVMALTSDQVFIFLAYGWQRAAWFAVHMLASDAATSGLPGPGRRPCHQRADWS
ncbi:MAG TPA: hypothetical protein VLW50_00380 [Streptosporangiaceae bacterium]|nr:hypothetical protein [Streptosporangiaceae bacterium]